MDDNFAAQDYRITAMFATRFRSHARLVSVIALTAIALPIGTQADAALVYDLAADWSDVTNPNGVWSYNGNTGVAITNSVADWEPGGSDFAVNQPAWAAASAPFPGHVPVWMKSIGGHAVTTDLPSGRVGMHAAPGVAAAGVTWTSPFDGAVRVEGGVWHMIDAGVHAFRGTSWELQLNGTKITEGAVAGSLVGGGLSPFSSTNPFDFAGGDAGASVLDNVSVATGDVITLQLTSGPFTESFAGVDLTITAVPECSVFPVLCCGLLALLTCGGRRLSRPTK